VICRFALKVNDEKKENVADHLLLEFGFVVQIKDFGEL